MIRRTPLRQVTPLRSHSPLGRAAVLRRRVPLRSRGRAPGPSREVRGVVLERDLYMCVRCGRPVIGEQGSIHHRKQKSLGGLHTPDNLVTLCGTGTTGCHGWVHEHVALAHDAGWLVHSGEDPARVPVLSISHGGSGLAVLLDADGGWTAAGEAA